MYNNPKFKRLFKGILVIAFVQMMIHLFIDYSGIAILRSDGTKSPYFFLVFLPIVITIVVLWSGVGHIFNCKKESLIGMGLSLFALAINYFVVNREPDGTYSLVNIILKQLVNLLPYFVFGYLLFKDKRVLKISLFSFVFSGIFLIGYGHELMRYLNEIAELFGLKNDPFIFRIKTGEHGTRLFMPLITLIKSFTLPILFLVFTQMIYALKNDHPYWSGKAIDLSNEYSKKKATVLFFIFRWSLYTIMFGTVSYFGMSYIQGTQSSLERLFTGFSVLVALYFISLTYRNFLTEYSISRNRIPSGLYFTWNLPFIGFLTWMIYLLLLKKRISLSERIKLFQSGKLETNAGLKMLLMFFFVIIAVYQLNRIGLRVDAESTPESLNHLFGVAISFGLMIWYFNHQSGIWAVLSLVFIQLVYMIFVGSEPTRYGNSSSYFANIFSVVVYSSLFHIATLKNITVAAREGNEEEE